MKAKKYAAAAVIMSAIMLTSCSGRYSEGDKQVKEGVELYEKADYAAALTTLTEAVNLELKTVKEETLYYYLGESCFKTGDYEKSLDYHKKAVAIKPDVFKSWVTIGVCYRKLGNESEALKAYSEALTYDPENSESVGLYVSLGSIYISNNKPFTAIDYLEKAAELYPEHSAAHAYLAIAYTMAFEYEKAESELALAEKYDYTEIEKVKESISKVKNR